MFGNFLIGLREGLEAALVVGILVAYLVKSGRRSLLTQVWAGVAVAVAVSLGVGAVLTYGPKGLSFEAQEAIGGTMSLIAVGFVTWMIFWMGRMSRQMKGAIEGRMERAISTSKLGLVMVATLVVGREGLETALILWSNAQSAGASSQPLVGAILGLVVAVVIGVLIYRGALTLDLGKFFRWTGALLVIVAAGVLAYAVHDLQEAGILPGVHELAFDVSAQVPPASWYGTLLKGTVNFSPATTWLELIAWSAYIVPVMYLFVRMAGTKSLAPEASSPARPTAPAVAASR
ncbi:MAG TPA: FTR1 family protein [Ilumatobacteraceae bacterium]|nr:FTR1 family protein [Ilumatobacteraceae bacterium]